MRAFVVTLLFFSLEVLGGFLFENDGVHKIYDSRGVMVHQSESDIFPLNGGFFLERNGSKFSILDGGGNVISSFTSSVVQKIYHIGDGIFSAKLKDGQYVFVDQNGVISDEKYDSIDYPFQSFWRVKIDGKWRVYNAASDQLFENEFLVIYPFLDGVASVYTENKKWRLINLEAEFITDEYDFITSYGKSWFSYKSGGDWYIKSLDTGEVTRVPFDGVSFGYGGVFPVQRGAKYGLIDSVGGVRLDVEFDEVIVDPSGVVLVRKDNKWGFYNYQGGRTASFKFEKILTDFTDGIVKVLLNGDAVLVNIYGEVIDKDL